jgi:hypothetical protein
LNLKLAFRGSRAQLAQSVLLARLEQLGHKAQLEQHRPFKALQDRLVQQAQRALLASLEQRGQILLLQGQPEQLELPV